MRILYISYDGMLDPLGQSQVLAYLRNLSLERNIHLISFEKAENWSNRDKRKFIADLIANSGIIWHPLRYHKRPTLLATAWDVIIGIGLGTCLVVNHRLQIVHARSYVPSVMALVLKKLTRIKFLFDMRGFWVDERVDAGLWPSGGLLYRIAKWFESRFLIEADHVISLTHSAVCEIERFDYLNERMPNITIIPTCADLNLFRPIKRNSNVTGFVLGYVGSVGTWYLFDEVVSCFIQLLHIKPVATLLILNINDHSYILERLVSAGVPKSVVELRSATNEEVPLQMARMDAGIFFIKPVFSKKASAPTKLAEFLGCGIPCLSNAGVGDMTKLLEEESVGVVLQAFDDLSVIEGLKKLLQLVEDPAARLRCVSSAKRHFSLDEGVARYANVYQKMIAED
jgi:glycosyltransferase involved in cell wall biosynthesis